MIEYHIYMNSGTYLYMPPIGIFAPSPEFFDSFDKIPKRIHSQMSNLPKGEWKLYKADGNIIFTCDKKGRKISTKK